MEGGESRERLHSMQGLEPELGWGRQERRERERWLVWAGIARQAQDLAAVLRPLHSLQNLHETLFNFSTLSGKGFIKSCEIFYRYHMLRVSCLHHSFERSGSRGA